MKAITTLSIAIVVLGLTACENPTAANGARIANSQAEASGSPFRWKTLSSSLTGGAVLTRVMVDLASGPSGADEELKRDVLALITKAEASEGRLNPQIEDIKPLKDGREVWILKSSQDGIAYIVTFKPAAQGGTDIQMNGPTKYEKHSG
jgi:hypothetical protein